ncbi:F-box protein CPR1 [Citrus sinensis]|uniref:F-box protein CPR1 n=1 Tax=Citrus sinensis TaxID=2711 RepID=A0ACB8LDB5_CITSI|nr:F-box protein CPR1 [Citrus sinensis]
MAGLPTDINIDILSRLSVKCLLRFKCVSKSFCSLIDSQEFIKIHLKRSIETNSNLSLILSGTPAPILDSSRYWGGKIFSAGLDSLNLGVELDHPFKNCKGRTPIIDSCNGLIAFKNDENGIALWNPSTEEHLILPKFWGDLKDFMVVDGFGYDAVNDDYKVVRLVQLVIGNVGYTEIAVYSLRTNSWRRIRVDFPYYILHGWDGTFADGHVHWLVTNNPEDYIENLIIAFNLKSEEFHEVPLPHLENRNDVLVMFVGNFSGCLYFSCLCNYPQPVDIWVLMGCWTKTFSFPRSVGDYVKALAYSKSGGKVLVDKFEYGEDEDINRWELFWYDLQNQGAAADQVTIYGVPQGCRDTIVCVDSLVSLAACAGRGVAGREGRMS